MQGSTGVLRAQGGRVLPHGCSLQEVALREVDHAVAPLQRLYFVLYISQDEVKWTGA